MKEENVNEVVFVGRTFALDEYGYLAMDEVWDEVFAVGMAPRVGILGGLKEPHWKLIRYLREKYENEKTVPLVITACIDNKLRLNLLRQLFPSGYHRGACKIAGLNYAFMASQNYLLTYENYATLKSEYRLTETGFLENLGQWNERFALMILSEGADDSRLTDKHREIISFLQGYYRANNKIPTVYETCKSNDIDLSDLERLFSGGYRRGACRAAGLPFFG